ncbi:hypothetical protein RHMOL_Rhmol13G0237700 [Rhododendron molle]|uniref:Uncharacterized protein n=1 Tax=Rhododendron molle TaxID=49168 RepID=A0ACC0LB30_RHOML|nr:hypothetical protein RHMOL_Rhmol13G0237700 [Rhododendron molle]
MASLVLLLSELLRHQSPDPGHPAASPISQRRPPPSSSSSVRRASAAPSCSPANWVAGSSVGYSKKEEVVVEDLPEPRFCSDLVWP